jgi:hypothetical protein
MKTRLLSQALAALFASAGLALPALAHDAGQAEQAGLDKVHPSKPSYSPYAGRNFPTRPFFGDTHLHTSYSMDAGAFGAKLGPRDAYRFAKGNEITASSGQPAKLSRPLDFLVVADHSDGMGFFPQVVGGDPAIMADAQGRKWNEMIHSGKGADAAIDIIRNFSAGTMPTAIFPVPGTKAYRGAWQETVRAAEEANEPGRFTAFIGYEWTSGGANNLHRNVIFRDNGDKASQVEPYTTIKPLGSDNPRRLVEVDGCVRGEDRRQRTGHRPQRQCVQRSHVPHGGGLRQEDRSRLCRGAHQVGTALRGDPDQGHRRGTPHVVAE